MFWEEPRVPGLPGAEDVTDGSVDYYDTDWENVENGALEEEMQKCNATPCTAQTTWSENKPEQTDVQAQEILPDCTEASSAHRRAGFSLL